MASHYTQGYTVFSLEGGLFQLKWQQKLNILPFGAKWKGPDPPPPLAETPVLPMFIQQQVSHRI